MYRTSAIGGYRTSAVGGYDRTSAVGGYRTSAVGGYGFPACPIVTSVVEWMQLAALVGIYLVRVRV